MTVMMMTVMMTIVMMMGRLQHNKYLNTHKSEGHGVRTEFKFHFSSEITLVPNTYEVVCDDDDDDDGDDSYDDDDDNDA